MQVSDQLKQGYKLDQLEDVRIIRDRQTSASLHFGATRGHS